MSVYLDHNATAPVRPSARAAMLDAFDRLGTAGANPSSPHRHGHEARLSLEAARAELAALIGASPREIVFVSGGTEADNLAVQGAARAWASAQGSPGAIVTTAIEHPAVLEPCRWLAEAGWRLTVVGADSTGRINSGDAIASIDGDTALVSVMLANNETGVVQPVEAIAAAARAMGAAVHVDAVQAAGRIAVDVRSLGADFVSLSSHKLGGPAGIGALWVREGAPLRPLMLGGGQERRRRPGTEPVVLAAGFAAAAREAADLTPMRRVAELRDRLEKTVLGEVRGARVNGAGVPRIPNTSSLTLPGLSNEALVIALDLRGFSISTGSACSTGAGRPSHVLAAMGLSSQAARCTIRVSLGPMTGSEEIDSFARVLCEEAAFRVEPVVRRRI